MQFFKISVILCFSVDLLYFFPPENFSQPSLDRFAPNLARMCLLACDFYWIKRLMKSSKTRSQQPKDIVNRSNFRPARHVFARSDETVKDFFAMISSRVLYLSENINHLAQWSVKKTDFDRNYLPNRTRYGQSLSGCLSETLLGFDPEWPWTEIQGGGSNFRPSPFRRLLVNFAQI